MSARQYRHFSRIDYLADLVGADVAADLLKVSIERADTPLDVSATALEIGTWSAGVLSIQEDTALDVSGATVPVEQQTPVTIEDVTAWSAGTLPVEQQTPVALQDDTGTLISPATEPTLSALAAALASNGGDTLQVDQQGVVDVSSRDARNLGDVDVTALPDNDTGFENGTAMASGGSITIPLAGPGADKLHGKVTRATTSYDVTIEWLDAPGGSVLFTTSVATGVAGGTETTIKDEKLLSPYINVVISDAGSGSGAVTATLNLT